MALEIRKTVIPVTITSGQSLSPAIALGAMTLVGISMPAGWDAAALTFQVSVDDATYQELFDRLGAAIQSAATANIYIELDPVTWAGINSLKIRSGTSGAPVAQSADRVLNLVARAL
jgi:hypothetical protein